MKIKGLIKGANSLSLGISIVVAIFIGAGIGYWLSNVFNQAWIFWVGIFWGVCGAGLNLYKAQQNLSKDFDKYARDPKLAPKPLSNDDDEDDEYEDDDYDYEDDDDNDFPETKKKQTKVK